MWLPAYGILADFAALHCTNRAEAAYFDAVKYHARLSTPWPARKSAASRIAVLQVEMKSNAFVIVA
jgi:hypothetical protein